MILYNRQHQNDRFHVIILQLEVISKCPCQLIVVLKKKIHRTPVVRFTIQKYPSQSAESFCCDNSFVDFVRDDEVSIDGGYFV